MYTDALTNPHDASTASILTNKPTITLAILLQKSIATKARLSDGNMFVCHPTTQKGREVGGRAPETDQ